MASPIPVTLVGATGLTGSSTLRNLLTSPTAFAVTALTRRAASATATPPNTYTNRVVSDLNDATTASDPIVPAKGTYISCLGTTRAAVGDDIKKQEAIDLFLNRDLATRAKKDGAGTMILVSSMGANATSWFAYPKMKGQLEDDVKALGFERTVILRPATLLHDNQRPDARAAETYLIKTIKCLRSIGVPTLSLGIDHDDVGAAIAQIAKNPPEGVTTLYDHDIHQLAEEFRATQQK